MTFAVCYFAACVALSAAPLAVRVIEWFELRRLLPRATWRRR